MWRISFVFFTMAIAAHAQNVTVQVNGQTVGTEKALNLTPGVGMTQACVDNRNAGRLDCAPSLNPAVVPTHDTIHANENYCVSANRSTAYTCRLSNRALTAYSVGMTFVLNADVSCASCSLNIDNLGPVTIKKVDGANDPGGTLIAGQPQWIFYDGTVFRLMGGASIAGTTADQRGDVQARRLIAAMDTIPYRSAMTLDVTAGDLHTIRTMPNGGNATLSASTAGLAGQHMWIIISNDAASAKTITFGANILGTGPLHGSPGKSATFAFVSDGTAWYEVSRTAGL